MTILANYIDGKLIAPLNDRYLPNVNPATGQVYSQIPDSASPDILQAIAAAKKAFPIWAKTTPAYRCEILLKIADLIEKNHEKLALAESIDTGKPLHLALQMDIPRAAANFRFFATALLHQQDKSFQTNAQVLNYTYRVPLGVVACISPWNLPLYLFTWKIAPALAAGNCVIGKPSELAPMTAFLLSQLCIEAQLPAGVLNIVHGIGAKTGAFLVGHHDIKAVSFTGGTATGAEIARIAAPSFKKLSLELGGKNPTIIFADAPYEQALETTLQSAFTNQGQICLCGSRIFVQKTIYEQFKHDFVKRTQHLKIGNPLDPQTQIGAVISEKHKQKIESYIALAEKEGGVILTGGKKVIMLGENANGFFVAPTIIEGLSPQCSINQEEIFGPVVTLQPFDTWQEVVEQANNTPYGLAANIWTTNLNTAHQVAHALDAGVIWVNTWLMRDLRTPFGGMKASGVGREGGFYALDFFSEEKNICLKIENS
ncbi:MAG: aldehyde dehydrogenase [Microscillaceae bacterium]|nr:aldehyde dehydrogenase [Microscillaceae bacterium]MDW8461294.1 aldehyde dehydrogenase [Cytophagales bacterium]